MSLGRWRRQCQETAVVVGLESCSVAAPISWQPALLMSVMRCFDTQTGVVDSLHVYSTCAELCPAATMG